MVQSCYSPLTISPAKPLRPSSQCIYWLDHPLAWGSCKGQGHAVWCCKWICYEQTCVNSLTDTLLLGLWPEPISWTIHRWLGHQRKKWSSLWRIGMWTTTEMVGWMSLKSMPIWRAMPICVTKQLHTQRRHYPVLVLQCKPQKTHKVEDKRAKENLKW